MAGASSARAIPQNPKGRESPIAAHLLCDLEKVFLRSPFSQKGNQEVLHVDPLIRKHRGRNYYR